MEKESNMTTALSAFTIGTPNKGYSKSVYDLSLTAGTYYRTPDNSTPWSNRMEIGGYLSGTFPVGDRVQITPNAHLGYSKAELNSDIEAPGTKKNTFTYGFGVDGKVVVTDNIAITASAGCKFQGYNQVASASYMSESDFSGEYLYGHWYVPGDYVEHSGSYSQFQNEMNSYNDAAREYNNMVDANNAPKNAEQGRVSLGVEFTNNNNTITGGIKGTYTHYEGFGEQKTTGNNLAAELYGSVNVGHGVKINGAVNTNKVATVGVSITGLLD